MRSNAFCSTLLGLVLCTAAAMVAKAQRPAADTGVIDVTLPPGAEIAINGTQYGARGHFELKPLETKWLYAYDVMARFRGGETAQRKVLIKGGWGVRLNLSPPDSSRPELVPQTGHTNVVKSVAFSPDGRQVLTGSEDRTAILWDASTGQQLRAFRGTPFG